MTKAVESGALGRIAGAMSDGSGPKFNRVVVDWTIVKDKTSATALAEKIRSARRTLGRRAAYPEGRRTGWVRRPSLRCAFAT